MIWKGNSQIIQQAAILVQYHLFSKGISKNMQMNLSYIQTFPQPFDLFYMEKVYLLREHQKSHLNCNVGTSDANDYPTNDWFYLVMNMVSDSIGIAAIEERCER